MKWSVNDKRNALMQRIETQMRDPEVLGESEIYRYVKEYPGQPDHGIAQHGCLLVSNMVIRGWFKQAGYASIDKWSNTRVWTEYKGMVGTIARRIAENQKRR